jgi:hypothetical protein
MNVYAAVRGSSTRKTRAAPNFLEGPVSIVSNDYWRQNFVDVLIPAAFKFWNQLTNIAAGNAILLDGIMTAALAEAQGLKDKRMICSKGIVTCGTAASGIGFSNGSHVDVNDIIDEKITAKFIDEIKLLKQSRMSNDKAVHKEVTEKIDYVLEFVRWFGKLSVPTTCNYEFVGNLFAGKEGRQREGSDTVEAYFLFPCLGIAILIENETCLQFYGGIMEHHTAMPIVVLRRIFEEPKRSSTLQEMVDSYLHGEVPVSTVQVVVVVVEEEEEEEQM